MAMLRASLLCVGITVLAAAVLAARTGPVAAGTGPPPTQGTLIISWPGDTNCDHEFDATDALVVLQYLVRLIPFQNCLRGSDVTCDGVRDARDVLALLRHTVALSVTRPAGCPPIGSAEQYQFGSTVTQQEADLVQNAVAVASIFFQQNFELSTGAFSIVLDSDLDALAAAYAENVAIPVATARDALETDGSGTGQTATFIYTGHATWTNATDGFVRESIIVRELFRIFEHELIGLPGLFREADSQTPYGGPRWLIEGSATWVQNVVVYAHKSLLPCQQVHNTAQLQTMESWTGMKTHPNSAALASMAVDYFIDQYSLKALADIWFHVGEGESWQSAFHDATGVTISDFYTNFAAYRVVRCP